MQAQIVSETTCAIDAEKQYNLCSQCQACYVGKTCLYNCATLGEQRIKKAEPVYKYMKDCGFLAQDLTNSDDEVLASVTKGSL